jgi:hypothetical protein
VTRFTTATEDAHRFTQTFAMTTNQPEIKKRKVSPDPDAGLPVSHLLIKRLSEKARLPTRGSTFAAGYDLYRYGLKGTMLRSLC